MDIIKRVSLFCFLFFFISPAIAMQKRYSDIKYALHELVHAHPGVVQRIIVGESDSGELIEGVAIGHGFTHNLVVATHHGNEYGSTEVALAIAQSLADQPITNQTIYVVPVVNIEGFNSRNRRERDEKGAYHDPNRDYPGPCGTEGPYRLKSTMALAKFIEKENIITSATLHTYYPAVVYPWGFATDNLATSYNDLFKSLVAFATETSHYQTGNSTEIIYPAIGAYEDFAFWRLGIWSILFELGTSHSPSQQDIDKMIRLNVSGIRKMLEQAPKERAINHEFTGNCEWLRLRAALNGKYDKHDE